jgi:hypothetical protein
MLVADESGAPRTPCARHHDWYDDWFKLHLPSSDLNWYDGWTNSHDDWYDDWDDNNRGAQTYEQCRRAQGARQVLAA